MGKLKALFCCRQAARRWAAGTSVRPSSGSRQVPSCPKPDSQQGRAQPQRGNPTPEASVTDEGDFWPPASQEEGSWVENSPPSNKNIQKVHSASAVVVGVGGVAW